MDTTYVLMIGVAILAMYFLMIRPGQKRAKAQQALMAEIAPGARVMLSSGVFGTVRHWGEKQAVVEVSPGVDLTVLKQAVVRPVKDDEDEFEYADIDESFVDESGVEQPTDSEPIDSQTVPEVGETYPQAELAEEPASETGATRSQPETSATNPDPVPPSDIDGQQPRQS